MNNQTILIQKRHRAAAFFSCVAILVLLSQSCMAQVGDTSRLSPQSEFEKKKPNSFFRTLANLAEMAAAKMDSLHTGVGKGFMRKSTTTKILEKSGFTNYVFNTDELVEFLQTALNQYVDANSTRLITQKKDFMIGIFGSYAREEQHELSDIDLLLSDTIDPRDVDNLITLLRLAVRWYTHQKTEVLGKNPTMNFWNRNTDGETELQFSFERLKELHFKYSQFIKDKSIIFVTPEGSYRRYFDEDNAPKKGASTTSA